MERLRDAARQGKAASKKEEALLQAARGGRGGVDIDQEVFEMADYYCVW